MKQKLTPWFPAEVNPVRAGVYEITGCQFKAPNYRKWLGDGWSGTFATPFQATFGSMVRYLPGEDMTGWRGLAEAPK